MAWVKLDDQFFINRKAVAIGSDGQLLFIASACYCAMQRNDGLLTSMDLPVIAAMARVPLEVGDSLIAEGMWHPEGAECPKCRAVGQVMPVPSGCISVHEYLKENLSREEADARRQRAEKAAAVRHGKQPGQSSPGSASSTASSTANGNASRLPIPSRPNGFSSSSSSSDSIGTSPPVDNCDDDGFVTVPPEVWDRYAQLMYDKQPPNTVNKPKPWKARTAVNASNELGAQAVSWMTKFEVKPHELAAWLVDGAPSRYAKPRETTP